MKAEDLKTKTQDELQKLLIDLKKQQMNLRFQLSQGQTQNSAQIRAVRRDVARVKTFLGKAKDGVAVAADKPKKAAAKKTGKKAAA